VLFHDRYRATPGVWRQYKDKKDEMRSIAISELLMSISSLVFIVASAHQGWTSLSKVAVAALVAWMMVPVPLLITNAVYSDESPDRRQPFAGMAGEASRDRDLRCARNEDLGEGNYQRNSGCPLLHESGRALARESTSR